MDYKDKIKEILEDKTIPEEQRKKLEEILSTAEKSENERIRNALITHCRNTRCVTEEGAEMIAKWIAWLENQGKYKSPEEVLKVRQDLYQSGYNDGYKHGCEDTKKQKYQGKSALEAAKEKKVDNSNKVKPKFHKGDFIRHNKANIIYKVILVNGSFYYIENIETSVRIGLFNVEQNFHLWTIADAKDGDILTFDNNVCTMGTIICKSPTSYDTKSYCRLIDEHFIGEEESGWDSRLLVPATKEQCDLLFQKMKEKDWEWDAEKKELKKIETIDIPFSAKDSELIEVTYFIPEGFHAEIVDNKVIIKKD